MATKRAYDLTAAIGALHTIDTLLQGAQITLATRHTYDYGDSSTQGLLQCVIEDLEWLEEHAEASDE